MCCTRRSACLRLADFLLVIDAANRLKRGKYAGLGGRKRNGAVRNAKGSGKAGRARLRLCSCGLSSMRWACACHLRDNESGGYHPSVSCWIFRTSFSPPYLLPRFWCLCFPLACPTLPYSTVICTGVVLHVRFHVQRKTTAVNEFQFTRVT